jgi:hypothetical protein
LYYIILFHYDNNLVLVDGYLGDLLALGEFPRQDDPVPTVHWLVFSLDDPIHVISSSKIIVGEDGKVKEQLLDGLVRAEPGARRKGGRSRLARSDAWLVEPSLKIS